MLPVTPNLPNERRKGGDHVLLHRSPPFLRIPRSAARYNGHAASVPPAVPACCAGSRLSIRKALTAESHRVGRRISCRASLLKEPGSVRHCPFPKLIYACSVPTMPRISFRSAGWSEEILTESRSFSSPAASFSSSEAYSTATVSPCLTDSPVFFRNSIPAA